MTTYAVAGAGGHLGHFAVSSLLSRGVPAGQVIALARTPDKAGDVAARGVKVRQADYSDPATLGPGLAGVDILLLVASTHSGQRVAQHAAVIDAARTAGVGRIVYTSTLRADDSHFPHAPDHLATESLLRRSGLEFTVLRNGWYIENYTDRIGQFLAQGEITGAAGDTPFTPATRADYADAATATMVGDGHAGAVYELGGTPLTMSDLAAAVTAASGTKVIYRNLTSAELLTALRGAGLPEEFARFIVVTNEITARGEFTTNSGDLQRLLQRPSTALVDAVKDALATVGVRAASAGDGDH